MKTKFNYTTGQLFNFTRDSYLERTSRPIYAIIFLLPFIFLYEAGTILINTDVLNQTQIRVVTFVWLQDLLEHLGTGSRVAWIAPPVFVVIILLGLQVASRTQWYFCLTDYGPMFAECIFLAIPLIVLSLLFNGPAAAPQSRPELAGLCGFLGRVFSVGSDGPVIRAVGLLASQVTHNSLSASIITGIGAGIYEELVFRLILICLLMLLFQDLIGLSHQSAIILSVLISAGLFSAHHHVVLLDGRLGQAVPFTWVEFIFRTLAGVYFAVLFAVRGFGITAGTHALYDVLATVVNAVFFRA